MSSAMPDHQPDKSAVKPIVPRLSPSLQRETLSYWCTWNAQSMYVQPQPISGREAMAEELLLHRPGWAATGYEPIRGELMLVVDDGWDVPFGVDFDNERWRFGSLELSEQRFPSCKGSPAQRLTMLREIVERLGWSGLGIWVSAQAVGDGRDGRIPPLEETKRYWVERAMWSREAGIRYWKVDWGARMHDTAFRQMLSDIVRSEAPEILIEHAWPAGPVNDYVKSRDAEAYLGSGRFGQWRQVCEPTKELLNHSHFLRTYDVLNQLSVPTTLDRIAWLLSNAPTGADRCILNCEDELYIGAALGCTLGIMRYQDLDAEPDPRYDPRRNCRRLDEATRAVRWQRIMPPMPVAVLDVNVSDRLLSDSWFYENGDTWAEHVIGKEIVQSAPAIIARGMPLPEVRSNGDAPYIVASRDGSGVIAVCALPRTFAGGHIETPEAEVSVDIGSGCGTIGVFGRFGRLILKGRRPVCVLAQDLASDEALDVTNRSIVSDYATVLTGELIKEIGTASASTGDLSDPGLVLKLVYDSRDR